MMRLAVLMLLPLVLGALSPSSFLQVKNIDDDNAKLEGEDDAETSKSDDESTDDEAESFIQVEKKNIDDDNAQAAEMARMEDETDKLEGEDDSETSKTDDEDSQTTEDDA